MFVKCSQIIPWNHNTVLMVIQIATRAEQWYRSRGRRALGALFETGYSRFAMESNSNGAAAAATTLSFLRLILFRHNSCHTFCSPNWTWSGVAFCMCGAADRFVVRWINFSLIVDRPTRAAIIISQGGRCCGKGCRCLWPMYAMVGCFIALVSDL